jgi:hypothetical protein
MEDENFFLLHQNEVQDFAKGIIGRKLTDTEYRNTKKMFEFGIENWSDILKIAIEESTSHVHKR